MSRWILIRAFILLAASSICAASPCLDDAPWPTICARYSSVDYPSADRPTKEEEAALAGLRSRDYYYGIGVPVDYVKARKIAFMEESGLGAKDDGSVFSGGNILMMIYANGLGVPRNLSIALHLACIDDGPAEEEMKGRVRALDGFAGKEGTPSFSFFDNFTSSSNYSQSDELDLERNASLWELAEADIAVPWTSEQRAAFSDLSRSASAFFYSSSYSEGQKIALDHSDMGGALFEFKESFLRHLQGFERGATPHFTSDQRTTADNAMKAAYGEIMSARPEGRLDDGQSQSELKESQELWLKYRDAWVSFGRLRYPATRAADWIAWCTWDRAIDLEELAGLPSLGAIEAPTPAPTAVPVPPATRVGSIDFRFCRSVHPSSTDRGYVTQYISDDESQFEHFYLAFIAAVRKSDLRSVEKMTQLPLYYEFPPSEDDQNHDDYKNKHECLTSPSEFEAQYGRIFNKGTQDRLSSPGDFTINDDGSILTGDLGDEIFFELDDRGFWKMTQVYQ
jgi:hypothetical protein